jgi:hypothetical protein
MYRIVGGLTGHWGKPEEITRMQMADGSKAETDEQNAEAISHHFETEVFARESTAAVESLEQRPIIGTRLPTNVSRVHSKNWTSKRTQSPW